MKPLCVLITGAGGLLGGRLAATLSTSFDVFAGVHRSPAPLGVPQVSLDVLSVASVEAALDEVRPAVAGRGVTHPRRGSGRYHLGGRERLNRYALGVRVASALSLPLDLLVPTTQAKDLIHLRPADVSLDSGRARRELGWQALPLDLAVLRGRLDPIDIIAGTGG